MKKETVALIYDFDGTLSPANMQEFGLIQAFGNNPQQFWQESGKLSSENDASEILCYMKQMIDEAKAKDWIAKGVQPTETVKNLLVKAGAIEKSEKLSPSKTKTKKSK